MSWLKEEIAMKWRAEGKRYAAEINEFVRIGMESNWEQAQQEPGEDQRSSMAADIVDMIRAANRTGDTERLRQEIPPASWPITSAFQEKQQAVKPIVCLNDGTILVSTNGGNIFIIQQDRITELSNLVHVGCSSDGNDFALITEHGIHTKRGTVSSLEECEEIAAWSWKDIQQSIKAILPDWESLADSEHPASHIVEAIPFDNGTRLLLVTDYGIYLIQKDDVVLLHPELADIQEYDYEDTHIDMAHGVVSPDGRWLAYGSQCSEHLLRDVASGTVHTFEPQSSYPHYASFAKDSRAVWYNACHFYNGATIQVPLDNIGQHRPETEYEWPLMNDEMRVYAAAALSDGHILGDAYGYLRKIDSTGKEIWRYFVGSTLYGIVASPDESRLAVGTYGGMLHLIDLKSGEKSAYSIGTANIVEVDRWILWRDEEPLRW
ncbi:WD40 repeat domain-containing protein [Paenibacillus sp. B1-33]|uniref:WD40 repeat domain-containing protein n=1 Tax=unclassified Paenibacillus TaxID=185978 RepID=UPI003D295C96